VELNLFCEEQIYQKFLCSFYKYNHHSAPDNGPAVTGKMQAGDTKKLWGAYDELHENCCLETGMQRSPDLLL
jgi:hypothetical protein